MPTMTAIMLGTLLSVLPFFVPDPAQAAEHREIRLVVGGKTLSATLENSPTGQDFWAMLPLSLNLRDYNNAEKISNLPRKLSTQDAPKGYQPAAGDLVLFVPWGNLAIFYRDASWHPELVKIGRITTNADAIATIQAGENIVIEQVK